MEERELRIIDAAGLLVKHWKGASVVGLLAAILAGLVLAVVPDTYEATATILVSRTRTKEEAVGLDRTVIELDSYAAALKSEAVLKELMEQNGLAQEPYRFSLEKMRNAVDILPIRNENSLRIRVRLPALEDQTPVKVAVIANLLAKQADRISRELIEEDIRRSMEVFDREYQKSSEHLETVRRKYQEAFLNAPLMEKERLINNLEREQAQLKTSLALAIADLEQKGPQLRVLDQLLEGEQPVVPLRRALEEIPSVMGIVQEQTGISGEKLYSATSTTEDLNTVYVNLRQLRDRVASEVQGLEQAVANLPKYIDRCMTEIEAAERIYNASSEAVDYWRQVLETAQLSFREVHKRRELAAMSIASDRQDLLTWVSAFPPEKPAGAPKVVWVVVVFLLAFTSYVLLLLVGRVIRLSVQG